MVEQAWYMVEFGEQRGPMSLEDVRAALMQASAGGETPVWTEGMPDWAEARRVSAVADVFRGRSGGSGGGSPGVPPRHPNGGHAGGSGFSAGSAGAYGAAGHGGPQTYAGDDVSVLLSVGCHVANLFTLPWSLLGIIPIVMKRDALSVWHGQQAVGAFAIYLVVSIVLAILGVVTCGIGWMLIVPVVILYYIDAIFGIVYAIKKERRPLPITGQWVANLFGAGDPRAMA